MLRRALLAALLSLVVTQATFAQPPASEATHRAEAIRRYESLLHNPSPALEGRRDELMFRLALLYLEEAQASGPSLGGSYYPRAVSLLDQVLARKNTIFREDALYYRAIALQDTGRTEESVIAFRSLLREFPASPRSAELWFRTGNHAIQKGRLQEALTAYEEVLRRADPNYRDQAAYMFAWTAFSLHHESRARTTLMDLLQRLEAGGQQQANLYPEGVELLAKVIRSEENPAVLSGPWIGSRPAFAPVVLRRVADLFRETSAYRQAATAYEQLLREYPDTADVDAVEKTIIDSWLKAGDPARAQEARGRLIQRHLALSGDRLKPESVPEIGPVVKDSALYLHRIGRETKRPDLYRQAVDGYQLYATSVGGGAEQWDAMFFQAEALKEMGDATGAADRYKLVAESHDAAHGEEAAFRRVALLEDLKQRGQASVDQVVGTYEDYFRLYPAGKRETELRVRYAGYLFD
ncbi:MAG: tetratricopeptide repeat protein, partial [Candidatus Binatia bacterium]